MLIECIRSLRAHSHALLRNTPRAASSLVTKHHFPSFVHKSAVFSQSRGLSGELFLPNGKTRHALLSKVGGLLFAFGAYSLSWYLFSAKVKADANVEVPDRLDDELEEPNTSVRFPHLIQVNEGGVLKEHRLVGAGPRFMTPLRVKVYAVGVYVDEKAARSALSGMQYSSVEELERDEKFWSIFSTPRNDVAVGKEGEHRKAFGKTFRLVCIREVAGKHMQNGFDRGLLKRVREADKKMNMPDGKQALKKFNSFFLEKGSMQVGCELLFVCSPNGTVDTWIDGVHYGQVCNDALCWALCDMFLGMKPVSKEIKQQVADGCFSWLQSSS